MALISSKIMYFQPILRYSGKAVLRHCVATTALTIPKLELSPFYNNGIFIPYLEPASLFSTDSKKPKKKEQADKKILKHVKLPFQKRNTSHIHKNKMSLFLRGLRKWGTITQKPGDLWLKI